VLVVEEDPVVAHALETLLANAGYTPVCTADGLAGLSHVQAGGIDLVLLDLDRPGGSGLALCP